MRPWLRKLLKARDSHPMLLFSSNPTPESFWIVLAEGKRRLVVRVHEWAQVVPLSVIKDSGLHSHGAKDI